ncbi:uncharacterized protein LOC144702590 [Wolffia australiana]
MPTRHVIRVFRGDDFSVTVNAPASSRVRVIIDGMSIPETTLTPPTTDDARQPRQRPPPEMRRVSSSQWTAEDVVRFLWNRSYVPSGNTEPCAVCMQYEMGEEVVMLPCCHVFHVDCVTMWLTLRHACPVCMRPALTNRGWRSEGRRRSQRLSQRMRTEGHP